MIGTLVDSNIILDLFTKDSHWFDWSANQIGQAAEAGPLIINPIIYSEISISFESLEDLEESLSPDLFEKRPIPWEACFLAGKCFVKYRKRGGAKALPLPDFFIGAHAAVEGLTLLTRDANRYKTYYPTVKLIHPEISKQSKSAK